MDKPGTGATAADSVLTALDEVLRQRLAADAGDSYVASLYAKGLNKVLEKIGEEATEVILAAKDHQQCNAESGNTTASADAARNALIGEVADLWFHSMVLLTERGLSSADVLSCLEQRFGLSGHAEKAAREMS